MLSYLALYVESPHHLYIIALTVVGPGGFMGFMGVASPPAFLLVSMKISTDLPFRGPDGNDGNVCSVFIELDDN